MGIKDLVNQRKKRSTSFLSGCPRTPPSEFLGKLLLLGILLQVFHRQWPSCQQVSQASLPREVYDPAQRGNARYNITVQDKEMKHWVRNRFEKQCDLKYILVLCLLCFSKVLGKGMQHVMAENKDGVEFDE